MNSMFIDILKKLIADQGREALLNPSKCKAFLADYTKGEYKKESHLLLQAIDAGVQKAIDTTGELELCKLQQIRVLKEELFLAAEAAEDVVDTLALVLRGKQESAASPICPNCGKELQKEWKTCPYCGTVVVKIQQAPPKTEITRAEPLKTELVKEERPKEKSLLERMPRRTPDERMPSAALTEQPPLNKKKNTKRNLIIAGVVLLVVLAIVGIKNEKTSTPATASSSSNSSQTSTPAVESSSSKPVSPAQKAIPANMVRVEGGTFQMGTVSGGYPDERPVRTVTVKSFYIGKYEVTQKEWQEIMGTNPSNFNGENLPVENVSWYDAIEYCNKRSIKEGLTPAYSGSGNNITCDWNANGYRLPTEAEWEYAAKGGNGSPGNYIYSGSNTIDDVAWYTNNSENRTHPVGTKAPNILGLYDMSGNVWEWCWDWYGSYSSDSQIDPRGAVFGTLRVMRGGSFFYYRGDIVSSAFRIHSFPSGRFSEDGFRLVRSYM